MTKDWIKEKNTQLQIQGAMEYYCKGDFKGILFIKFASAADIKKAGEIIREAKIHYDGNTIWAKVEQPLDVRVRESFLFGLKKKLIE